MLPGLPLQGCPALAPAGAPGMQMHWNSPIWSRQVASFWHGFETHSLTSISQRGPV